MLAKNEVKKRIWDEVYASNSIYLSAFVDFANIFIRYRSRQSTSELSLIATVDV